MFTQSEAIGPEDVVGNQGDAAGSIKTTLLDFGWISPVGPVHEAAKQTHTENLSPFRSPNIPLLSVRETDS